MTDPKVDFRIGESDKNNESSASDSPEDLGVADNERELPLEEHDKNPESQKEKSVREYREAQKKILEGTKSPWPGWTTADDKTSGTFKNTN